MDNETILNSIGEIQYELAKVKKKLDDLIAQSTHIKEIHPVLEGAVIALHNINDEIFENIEIEKWVLMNSLN